MNKFNSAKNLKYLKNEFYIMKKIFPYAQP